MIIPRRILRLESDPGVIRMHRLGLRSLQLHARNRAGNLADSGCAPAKCSGLNKPQPGRG